MFCYYQETEENGDYWWLRFREGFISEGKGNENEQFKERHIYIREWMRKRDRERWREKRRACIALMLSDFHYSLGHGFRRLW